MAWLGVFNIVSPGGQGSYCLFIFDDGLVIVRGSVARALSVGIIGSNEPNELRSKLEAIGPDLGASQAANVLPRAILIPLDDIVAGEMSGSKFKITTRSRRLFTGYSHKLQGRLRKDDLVVGQQVLATALRERWNGGTK